ncbi:hypothetical protein EDB84DRAFT_1444620 [Lactarius hengduanensis]|nr:hypothetical protein EDB84DRAFT_1444620 [Lactarius hengduanensis]
MVITHLLQNQDVLGRLMIGNIIIHLFQCAGERVLLDLPDLLQVMLVQMQMAQMAMFLQSLVVPFAYLVYRHHNATLNQLEATHLGQWYIPYISPYRHGTTLSHVHSWEGEEEWEDVEGASWDEMLLDEGNDAEMADNESNLESN